ncbi:MAG: response regulator transcription factor [Bacteroidia bacterium]
MIKVAIADDHDLFVEGLSSLLTQSNEIEVVIKAKNGKELIDTLYANYAEVLLLDIDMPKLDGKATLEVIKELWPKMKVLMLTVHDEVSYIKKFTSLPIDGYLLKDTDAIELIMAIKKVCNGDTEMYIPEVIKSKLSNSELKSKDSESPVSILTDREIQIVKMISKELTASEISAQLSISINTIKTHRKNILRKLKLSNSLGIAKFAIENELI